jgi:hypothetical protein
MSSVLNLMFKCRLQVGTIIEPASEFYSSRLAKRERKTTLVDEMLSDPSLKSYRYAHPAYFFLMKCNYPALSVIFCL